MFTPIVLGSWQLIAHIYTFTTPIFEEMSAKKIGSSVVWKYNRPLMKGVSHYYYEKGVHKLPHNLTH